MELRRLEYFVAVAEERSFTRASQRVHLVQSALSASIKSLEHELGTLLFDRTTHRVELTDAGRALLPEARTTLAAAQAARDAVDAVAGGLRGRLDIGIMQSLSIIDLASLITRFRRERPDVELRPRPTRGGSAELVRDVISGGLDLAFVSLPGSTHAGLTITSLASDPILLAVPPGHRLESRKTVSLMELAGETFVETPEGWGTRRVTERALARVGVERHISVEVADLATLTELVRAGLGLGFMPASTVGSAQRVSLIPLDPGLTWEISLAIPSNRRRSAAAHAFEQLVRETWPSDDVLQTG
ncbi:MAG: LysR family transcriptional regulator [Actinomycetota bacterium]